MTIEEFARRKNIKKIETVIGWILKGYIPGASLENDFIPNSARLPYVEARAKDAKAIYWSIYRASKKQKHVTYRMYPTTTEREFLYYIDQLILAGLITNRVEDEVTYYDVPLSALNYNYSQFLRIIEAISRGAAQGGTTAILEHQASVGA